MLLNSSFFDPALKLILRRGILYVLNQHKLQALNVWKLLKPGRIGYSDVLRNRCRCVVFPGGTKDKMKRADYCRFQTRWLLRSGSWLMSGRSKHPVSFTDDYY